MGDQLFAQEKTERGLPRSDINEATGASYQKILCIESVSVVVAELHPRAKRARGRSSIAKEMW